MEDKVKILAKHFIENDNEKPRNAVIRAKDEIDDYLILNDEEANEKAKEYILYSFWAFNYDFLCGHSEAISNIPKKEYTEMASRLCESFNKAVIAMIDNIDDCIKDAISCDGRGHFLSPYDGEENEVKFKGEYYYIYRQN